MSRQSGCDEKAGQYSGVLAGLLRLTKALEPGRPRHGLCAVRSPCTKRREPLRPDQLIQERTRCSPAPGRTESKTQK
ncbi:hypothetical protein MHYP_G00070400 [Metynnis hypsauchen]